MRSPYLNRELSQLEFIARVVSVAEDRAHPLLERIKFLAISGQNLDHFFQVRVAGLERSQPDVHLSSIADGGR